MPTPQSDQELSEWLRAAQPPHPPVNQASLVELLVEQSESTDARSMAYEPLAVREFSAASRLFAALLAISAVVCVAFFLRNWQSHRSSDHAFEMAANIEAEVSIATSTLVQSIALSASDPFAGWTEEQLISKLEQLDQEAMAIEDKLWKHRSRTNAQRKYAQPLSETKLAVLRSSEALWLAAETAPSDGGLDHATTLKTLYPNSTAASRSHEK